MIKDVLNHIGENVNTLNAGVFNHFSTNCIRIKGRVIKGFGFESEDAGMSDIEGRGFYIRYNGTITYTNNAKSIRSGSKPIRLIAPLRLCVYDFEDTPLDPFLIEQKMRNDLLSIRDKSYVSESQKMVDLEIRSCILNNYEAIMNELEVKSWDDLGKNAKNTVVIIDFNLTLDCYHDSCITLC